MGQGAPESSVTSVAAASMNQQGSMRTGLRGRATEQPEGRKVFPPLPLHTIFPPVHGVDMSLVFSEIPYFFSAQLLSNF